MTQKIFSRPTWAEEEVLRSQQKLRRYGWHVLTEGKMEAKTIKTQGESPSLCTVQRQHGSTSSWHHFPPIGSKHSSAQPSAAHYLCEEETRHYAMLNYKMSLSISCKGAEWIQIHCKVNKSQGKYKSHNTEFIKLHALYFFSFFKVSKVSRKMQWVRLHLFHWDNGLPEYLTK